jgi:hypothetical protein
LSFGREKLKREAKSFLKILNSSSSGEFHERQTTNDDYHHHQQQPSLSLRTRVINHSDTVVYAHSNMVTKKVFDGKRINKQFER